jgi:ketosteroid isomerase-like protein
MTDQQIKDAIRGFLKSWTSGDAKNALSFFAEDALFITPLGKFKGTAQIEKYITWVNRVTRDYQMTETGMGIITRGDIGVIEYNLSGISRGIKWETPAMCMYEFKNDKIVNVRGYYNVLSRSRQTTKGVSRWLVNLIENASRKGF